jgi:hypothetical protein
VSVAALLIVELEPIPALAFYRGPGFVIGEALAHFGVDGFLDAVAPPLRVFESDPLPSPSANVFGNAVRVEIREQNPAKGNGM